MRTPHTNTNLVASLSTLQYASDFNDANCCLNMKGGSVGSHTERLRIQ